MNSGGVGGEGVFGGIVAAAQFAWESLRLRRVLVSDVRFEVVLIADHFVTEGAHATTARRGRAAAIT